jgi:diaminopimelate decarboxylase
VTFDLLEAGREAAARFGTPLYLYDLVRLRADALAVAGAFPDPWLRLYSLKANGLPALLRHIALLGFGASAVSGGEVDLARRGGFPVERTALEGIGKSGADLRTAARLAAAGTPLLWVSLESAEEAAALCDAVLRLRRGRGRRANPARLDVLVRVNPQVQPETHTGLAVGAAGSKFGVLPEEMAEVIAAGGGPSGPLRWRGIHLHVGSQLGAVDAWRSAFRQGLRLLALQRASLPDFDTLDAGSGFPVDFGVAGAVPPVARFGEEAAAELAAVPAEARPGRLAVEPGRAVVAGSGWVIGRVLHVRQREPRIVVLDAGMTELIRPALYGAEHPMKALTSLGRPLPSDAADSGITALATSLPRVRVDGPICESTDSIGNAPLPPLQRGDLVAIGVAGAYGSSMASTYNGRPRPPEAGWDADGLRLLRPRGSRRSLP